MICFDKYVCLFLCFSLVYMEQYYKQFEIVSGKTITGMPPQHNAVSTSQCIAFCLQEKSCVAIVYNQTNLNCYLLNSTLSPKDTDDSGTSYVLVGALYSGESCYVTGGCMDGWMEFDGSCYLIDLNEYTWTASMNMCNQLGARLIEVETPAEFEFIQNILMNENHLAFWVGYFMPMNGSTWQLASTGVSASYTVWDNSQPNQIRTPNCAAFWRTFDYMWGDESCDEEYHPICEQDATYNMN